jgi:hypothetical protein
LSRISDRIKYFSEDHIPFVKFDFGSFKWGEYDFIGERETDLSFYKDDMLRILPGQKWKPERYPKGVWLVAFHDRKKGGIGNVPSNYLR